jgi:hypothetical protein
MALARALDVLGSISSVHELQGGRLPVPARCQRSVLPAPRALSLVHSQGLLPEFAPTVALQGIVCMIIAHI